jgi:hypothetical protein
MSSIEVCPDQRSPLSRIADALFGSDQRPRPIAEPPLGPFRIVGSSGNHMEIEDSTGLRSTVPVSHGLSVKLAIILRRHGLATPFGLTVRREPFDVEGTVFYRWTVEEPAYSGVIDGKPTHVAVC